MCAQIIQKILFLYLFESRKHLMVGGFEDLTSASWCNMTLWKVLYNRFFFFLKN